ncbi:hypothetical protein FBU31_002834 [Coemansia sp. 'formosensis']|nr:hypothetical protein FBU31_002834 [Coemansia sp. 'formosensis']
MGNSMSFSVTPAEEERVQIFKSMGITLDPRQAADLIMVIVISVAYVFRFASLLFMLWNRKYPPIKAKNPLIMTLVFISSIFWFVGDIQINNHTPLKGTSMTQCKAIGVWMHIVLGVCSVSALIGLRSYGLFQVFCLNRPYRGPPLYISIAATSLFLLTFGIIISALPGRLTVMYVDAIDMCSLTDGYKAAVLSVIWVTLLIVAWFNWRIRNIKSSFNEVREVTIAGAVVFSILTFTTVLSYAMPAYPLNVRVRILSTSLGHLATALIWWMTMGVPLFMCLTNREGYLKQWIQKLRQDGLQRAYHVDSGGQQSQHLGHSDDQQFISMPGLNKDLEFANANGEFYYAANDNISAEKAVTQISSIPPVGPVFGHDNASENLMPSTSGLVPSPLPPPHQAYRRPWEKIANVVGNIGVSQPGHSSPASTPVNAQFYSPIINFSETATSTPLPPDSAHDKSSINNRQLL